MSLPQINDELNSTTYTYREPNLTYKINEKTVTNNIDKIESIKQAIYHILMTERYSNPIYGNDYGVEMEQYIGKDFGYVVAHIQETLNDALLQDDRITSVIVNDISKSNKQQNACLILFTVYTIYGDFQEETSVLV